MSPSPEPFPAQPPGRERRAFLRYAIAGQPEWQVLLLLGQATCPALVRDISMGGIGLLVDQAIEQGMLLSVELTNTSQLFSSTRPARVVHVLPQLEGNFLLGCAFVEALTYEEMYALLQR